MTPELICLPTVVYCRDYSDTLNTVYTRSRGEGKEPTVLKAGKRDSKILG